MVHEARDGIIVSCQSWWIPATCRESSCYEVTKIHTKRCQCKRMQQRPNRHVAHAERMCRTAEKILPCTTCHSIGVLIENQSAISQVWDEGRQEMLYR